jgi:hypothetical protein
MERLLVEAMNEDANNADKMEELARDLRVKFEPLKACSKESKTSKTDDTDVLCKALAATGTSKKHKSTPPPDL